MLAHTLRNRTMAHKLEKCHVDKLRDELEQGIEVLAKDCGPIEISFDE